MGMLVAAYDQTGPHLFQTCPSGNYFEYLAMAIGARSQSAKTYLEKHFEDFEVRAHGYGIGDCDRVAGHTKRGGWGAGLCTQLLLALVL